MKISSPALHGSGESDYERLRRELVEELGINVKEMKFYAEFTTHASDKPDCVTVRAHIHTIDGMPRPAGEIEEITWVLIASLREAKWEMS